MILLFFIGLNTLLGSILWRRSSTSHGYFMLMMIWYEDHQWSHINLNNYNSRMFLHIFFFIYLLLLILYAIYTGLNHYRMQASGKVHPQVVTFLVPFMVNVSIILFSFCWRNLFSLGLSLWLALYFLAWWYFSLGRRFRK